MADNMMLATIHILVGFEMFGLGFINSGHPGDTEEAMFIIGFLLYLTAAILIILIKGAGLGGNKIAIIATLILAFLAAIFVLVGVILWGDHNNGNNNRAYVMTIDCIGVAMAIIGGVFLILSVVGGGKTGP